MYPEATKSPRDESSVGLLKELDALVSRIHRVSLSTDSLRQSHFGAHPSLAQAGGEPHPPQQGFLPAAFESVTAANRLLESVEADVRAIAQSYGITENGPAAATGTYR